MIDKLEAIHDRYIYLEEQLADPAVIGDMDRYKRVSKEYKDLEPVIKAYLRYRDVLEGFKSSKQLLQDEDREMREMAKQEMQILEEEQETLEQEIKMLLIPKDPQDDKDVIIEIRAGTGGDEAGIFAGDLLRMYTRYIESQGWKMDLISAQEGDAGGYSKVVFEVLGDAIYGKLKFESGAHRVQRVPKTESQGRVHTSAATVAVLPKMEMEEVNINKADLKVDTFRSSGAGGQHVNKTESGVRFTHLPTGIVSESTDGRSQIQNREIALQKLYQRIYDVQKTEFESKISAERRSMVGSGDRSEKIRTYNYPQNRLTDHRINLTLYNLDQIMEGNLEPVIEALQVAENAQKMKGNEGE